MSLSAARPSRLARAGRFVRPLAAAVLGAAAGAAAFCASETLPREGEVARGVRVGGVEIARGEDARSAVEAAARRALDRRVALTWGGETLIEASIAELGGHVDTAFLAGRAAAVAREGGILARLDAALEARAGHVDLPVRVELPVEPLAERLARLKEERDTAPRAAKLDIAHHTATDHAPGRYLDVYAAAAAVVDALAAPPGGGPASVVVPAFEIAPRASSEAVLAIDTGVVLSRFETHFGYLGDQVGRAQNVHRAAEQMDGVVLMPGEVVSFNANVGARSEDNGFAEAPEIYKGELRPGIGGGTCQVAGTLHAAAFFGGLKIVERSSHSRPSGYIKMGLDATVVYPTVDLKLVDPYDFPVVVHASIDKGTLAFELYGKRRPATVTYATETVGTADYKRKVEELATLAEGKAKLKQKGIRGISIRKTRTIHLVDGADRVEVTTDTYPPTFEIYQVGPGTDVDEVLPPLPDSATAANDAAVEQAKPAVAASGH
jgi:vancomycin resistance protein YoaR